MNSINPLTLVPAVDDRATPLDIASSPQRIAENGLGKQQHKEYLKLLKERQGDSPARSANDVSDRDLRSQRADDQKLLNNRDGSSDRSEPVDSKSQTTRETTQNESVTASERPSRSRLDSRESSDSTSSVSSRERLQLADTDTQSVNKLAEGRENSHEILSQSNSLAVNNATAPIDLPDVLPPALVDALDQSIAEESIEDNLAVEGNGHSSEGVVLQSLPPQFAETFRNASEQAVPQSASQQVIVPPTESDTTTKVPSPADATSLSESKETVQPAITNAGVTSITTEHSADAQPSPLPVVEGFVAQSVTSAENVIPLAQTSPQKNNVGAAFSTSDQLVTFVDGQKTSASSPFQQLSGPQLSGGEFALNFETATDRAAGWAFSEGASTSATIHQEHQLFENTLQTNVTGQPSPSPLPSSSTEQSPSLSVDATASERMTTITSAAQGATQSTTAPASNLSTAGVERVLTAIEQLHQRSQPLRVRLDPPELGSLQIEVRPIDGVVTARLQVENAAARQAVLESLPLLREALQQYQVARVDVHATTDQQGPGNMPFSERQDQSGQHNQSHENETGDVPVAESAKIESELTDSSSRQRVSQQSLTGLDIQL